MNLCILRYLALCLSISLPYTLYGNTEKSCPPFLFGTSIQLENPKSISNEADKMKSCLNLMTSERGPQVAKEIHQDPELMQQFDEYYVDIQVECDSFLNSDQTPDYCPEILSWTEELGETINQQLNVTKSSDPLGTLIEFSGQLDDYDGKSSTENRIGEVQSSLLGKHINDSARTQKTIQQVSGREKMVEACQFLKDRNWVGLEVSDLKEWVNVIEEIYRSQQETQLNTQAFCFLKTYYEAIEDYDSLMVLLLEMPEGDNFCNQQ